MQSRICVALAVAGAGVLGIPACAQRREQQPQQTEVSDIYADAGWYRDRVEPEANWEGELTRREVAIGPASRNGLYFKLVTPKATFDIYAAGVREKLQAFVGHRVKVRAKLIDLASEGFGRELWIGSIWLMENDRSK